MNKDEALKLALEALEELTDTEQTYGALERGDAAITTIKEALAQPEQEPDCQTTGVCVRSGLYVARQDHIPDAGEMVTKEVSLPEQEPVGGQSRFIDEGTWSMCSAEHVRMILATPQVWKGYEARYLYTASPQRQPLPKLNPENYEDAPL